MSYRCRWWLAFGLLLLAWTLYLAALELPSAGWGFVSVATQCDSGWAMLALTFIPYAWIVPPILGYCLSNVVFWLSPIVLCMHVREHRKGPGFFAVLLAASEILGWTAPIFVWPLCIGYFAWLASYALAAAAFFTLCVPMPRQLRRRSLQCIPTIARGMTV